MNQEKINELLKQGFVLVENGQTISPVEGNKFLVVGGIVTVAGQSGGDCWASDSATMNK